MASGGEDSDSSQPTDGSAVFRAPSAEKDLSGGLDWSGALGSAWLAQPPLRGESPSLQEDGAMHEQLVPPLQEDTSVQEQQVDIPPQPKAPGRRSKRDRPPKSKGKAPLLWTEDRIDALLRLRYVSLRDRFDNSKSNQQVKECWDLLTSAVGTKIGENIDSEQCKNKLKHMKRLWNAYNNDVQQTGNNGPIDDPPCLSLMRDLWADSDGLRSTPFVSSTSNLATASRRVSTPHEITTGDHVAETSSGAPDLSSSTPTASISDDTTTLSHAPSNLTPASQQGKKTRDRRGKKAKTQGDHVIKGMELLSSSIAKVVSAISQTSDKTPGDGDSISTRILEKLFEQQQHQTQISTQLMQQQQLQSEAMQQMLSQLVRISEKLSGDK